jgi:hypothetical protein
LVGRTEENREEPRDSRCIDRGLGRAFLATPTYSDERGGIEGNAVYTACNSVATIPTPTVVMAGYLVAELLSSVYSAEAKILAAKNFKMIVRWKKL